MAEQLGVARATVVEAYEQLSGEGYVETRLGSATTVAAELPDMLLATGRKPASPTHGIRPTREPARPFRTGLVDWEQFPHDDWGRILGRFWRNPPITLLEHNDVFGWFPLRQAIAAHLFEWRGIECDPAQVIITAGGADAFDLIRRAVFAEGDDMLLEEPGYSTARRVFSLGGLSIVAAPVDREGMNVAQAIAMAPKAKGAFVTPARQYPTGVTMPLSRRLELLAWAKTTNAIIIEDDYDSEYRYVGRPLPALMSLDQTASVIYSGTFSKVFSPIVRVGFMVVPQRLMTIFQDERRNFGAPPSLVVQPALAQFMEQGQFAVHIRRMRRLYAARRDSLITYLKQFEPKLFTVDAPPSGLMILLHLPKGMKDKGLVDSLAAQGIEVQSLSSHFVGKATAQGLLLSFAGFTERDLLQSAEKLVAILREAS
jgi:GntR family transcriptional regulator/MocR family aminotransferase